MHSNSIEEFELWILTVTLPARPKLFAELEIGHAVGPILLLWAWELDVTVHSTCLNARMGG